MIIFTAAFALGVGVLSAIARKNSRTKRKRTTKRRLNDDELITVVLPTIKSLD